MANILFGKYEIIKLIDSGGMGEVYLAKQTTLGRQVAIKKLHENLRNNQELLDRFNNEAKILANLNHPNIVSVYDFMIEGDDVYIIMEFVEGVSLDKIIQNNPGRLSHDNLQTILVQILDAVNYAHAVNTNRNGIIHRDIKPSNIMVSGNFNSKILDFGIAKLSNESKALTQAGTKLGTIFYMSPEQVLGQDVDHRSDIYSIGILMFEMYTGRVPFGHDKTSEFEIFDAIVKEPIPHLSNFTQENNDDIQYILYKATAKNPADRYYTCEEFKNDLVSASGSGVNKKAFDVNQFSQANPKYDSFKRTQISSTPPPLTTDPYYTNSTKPAKSYRGVTYIGLGAFLIIAILLIYPLLTGNPKTTFKIEPGQSMITVNDSTFQILFGEKSNLNIKLISEKDLSKDDYKLSLMGSLKSLNSPTKSGDEFIYTSDYDVNSLFLSGNPEIITLEVKNPKRNVINSKKVKIEILKPSVSTTKFIDDYLTTYSAAINYNNYSELTQSSNYWDVSKSYEVLNIMQRGYSYLTYMDYTNVSSVNQLQVSANVNFYYYAYSNKMYNYVYDLKVVKVGNEPVWKIAKAKETVIR